ncbi:MAG: membrane protein insertase YidC [Polyangiaceae bacterium]|nr:membrane protein insertase YidC [Polyangiaceae bacterium]
MDRSSILRSLAIAGVITLLLYFGFTHFVGGDGGKPAPPTAELFRAPEGRAAPTSKKAEETYCELKGNRFKAVTTTRGASLEHLYLDDAKYKEGGKPLDLVTTPDVEYQALRVDLSSPSAKDQVKYDWFDWKLAERSDTSCSFVYEDDHVALKKVIRAGERPYELSVSVTVENRKQEKATHRLAIDNPAWRYEREVEGGFGRQSPFVTTVECVRESTVEEKTAHDFTPKDFEKNEYREGWYTMAPVSFASTSNFYFAQALVPLSGPGPAGCQLRVTPYDKTGAMYRSRLFWQPKELGPGEKQSYEALAFFGPKERDVLAAAGGGQHHLSELIKLGKFAFIAKYLVWFLIKMQGLSGSWGMAIVLLTVAVRTVLFPLTWKSIQSGAAMRRIKPEIDALNEKYKDDAQQKQLATMELYKKQGVNPFAGCLPMLAQMPVWFALYTSLQTAAELFHTPFLWFKDLSAPDTIHVASWDLPFVLPWLLGATSFLQQKIMPPGQMDPAQQKMMMYLMPSIFTAMMLFLPSGLGVYMFTNSVLGIVQQLAVERYYAKQAPKSGDIEVRDKPADDSLATKKT